MEIQKASLFKRIISALFDFMIAFVVGSLLTSFIGTPIANKTTKIIENSNEYASELFDLGYYAILNDKTIITFNDSEETINNAKEEIKKSSSDYSYITLNDERIEIDANQLDDHLTHFYSLIDGESIYTKFKKDNTTLFEVDEDGAIKIKDIENKEEQLKEFYLSIYNKVLTDSDTTSKLIEYKDGVLVTLSSSINSIRNTVTYICLFASIIVFYFVIPMFTKKSQTIGKKLMSLVVVDIKTGQLENKVQLTIRFFAFAIIEVLLSLVLPLMLPVIISLIVMLINKKGQSIHDLLAKTTVVDLMFHSFEDLSKKEDVIEAEASEKAENIETAL